MKVLVAEDQTMFLEYVVSLLKKRENELEIIVAKNGKDAFGMIHGNKIDILITDLNMPKLNGIKLIEKTRASYPKVKIVVLTQYQNKGLLRKMKKLKVDGFLTKNASQEDFHEMLNRVISGNFSFMTDTPSSNNLDHVNEEEKLLMDPFPKMSQLSKRETEIIKILLENKSNQEIANQLFIGVETVISHRKNIYRKLGVNNILDLYKLVSELR
ncbi:MAG: response regulator [Crocinitomix sp.]|nr:response regulator [Crocinitomix sp.]